MCLDLKVKNLPIGANALVINGNRRMGARNSRIAQIMQDRLREREREMQIQERENEMIKELNERINETKLNTDLDRDTRQLVIQGYVDRITRIHEGRAEREALAAEREIMRQQAVIEETSRTGEVPNQEHDTKEEAEEAKERASIKGLTRLAVAQHTINTLQRTRASLSSEAGQIRRAIESDNSSQVKIGIVGSDNLLASGTTESAAPGSAGLGITGSSLAAASQAATSTMAASDIETAAKSAAQSNSATGLERGMVINIRTGYANDFRNRELANLNKSIARTEGAINAAIAGMYKDNQQLQENQLEEYRQLSDEDYDYIYNTEVEL